MDSSDHVGAEEQAENTTTLKYFHEEYLKKQFYTNNTQQISPTALNCFPSFALNQPDPFISIVGLHQFLREIPGSLRD